MNKLLLSAALAGVAVVAAAGSASAAINITNVSGDVLAPGFTTVATFDTTPASGYSLSGTYDVFTTSESNAAAPPGDNTAFVGLQTGQSLTLSSVAGFTEVSFYMGSPDSYNEVVVDGQTFDGSALMGLPVISSNGDQGVGRTVTYDLGELTHSITFNSSGVAFEFDNISVAGVPEPATWAMMLVGFGGIGAAMRMARRKNVALATA